MDSFIFNHVGEGFCQTPIQDLGPLMLVPIKEPSLCVCTRDFLFESLQKSL